jgi:hypothetical protein
MRNRKPRAGTLPLCYLCAPSPQNQVARTPPEEEIRVLSERRLHVPFKGLKCALMGSDQTLPRRIREWKKTKNERACYGLTGDLSFLFGD